MATHGSRRKSWQFIFLSDSNYVYGLLNPHELDYELDTNHNNHGKILAGIQCVDKVERSKLIHKWLNIELENFNDNWPQFHQNNDEFKIYGNVPIHTRIGRVVAMDIDSDKKLSNYIQPSYHYSNQIMNQRSSIHVYLLLVNEQNTTDHNATLNRTGWISTTINRSSPYHKTSLIYKHSNEHIPNMIQMDSLTDRIELYSEAVL
ncbi:unnamed protein product [Schistosoma spindalis]|nr:unnamed protein product [Schistosoma spindale]